MAWDYTFRQLELFAEMAIERESAKAGKLI